MLNACEALGQPLVGGVTAVTGFDRGSGKTAFIAATLPTVRRAGPVALFSIGVDGRLGEGDSSPVLRVEPGDVVLTTEAVARASDARFELLDAVRGKTALGRLLLGRVVRRGSVALVGSEHLSILAELIGRVRSEGWATTVLVDGAVSRITQVMALGPLKFVFTARADRDSLPRVAARVRALATLASLPISETPPEGAVRVDGPLTETVLDGLPAGFEALSVADLTKVFLPPARLLRLVEQTPVTVRSRAELLGFAVSRRGLSAKALTDALGDAAPWLLPDPYEETP